MTHSLYPQSIVCIALIFPPGCALAAPRAISIKHTAAKPVYNRAALASKNRIDEYVTVAVPRKPGKHIVAYMAPDDDLTIIRTRHTKKMAGWQVLPCERWCNDPLMIKWCSKQHEHTQGKGKQALVTETKETDRDICTQALTLSEEKISRVPRSIINIARKEAQKNVERMEDPVARAKTRDAITALIRMDQRPTKRIIKRSPKQRTKRR